MGDVHQELLSHLKLNLAGLPDRAITEEMLDAIAKPFLIEVEKVHSTVLKKVWTDVILPCVVTLIILTFVGILCLLLKRGQLYIMRACIQRLLRGGTKMNQKNNACPELQMSYNNFLHPPEPMGMRRPLIFPKEKINSDPSSDLLKRVRF